MTASTNPMLESLARLVQAIAHDQKLRRWFCKLAKKSAAERRMEIYATTGKMTEQGEDAKIVASLELLADIKTFDAACDALREHGHIKE